MIIVANLIITVLLSRQAGGQDKSKIFEGWEKGFQAFIIIEFALKVVAMGFLFKNGYLENNWNKLDFVVLLTNYFGKQGNIIRSYRLLKLLYYFPSVKLLSDILYNSLAKISDILLIAIVIHIVFFSVELSI